MPKPLTLSPTGALRLLQAAALITCVAALSACATINTIRPAASETAPSAQSSDSNQADPRNRRWSDGRLPSYGSNAARSQENRTAGNPIRIGLLAPLSGPYAAYGQSLTDAAALALFDADVRRPVELLPRDTFASAEGAAAATIDALSNGASVLIGPITPEGGIAAARAAVGGGAPLLLLTGDRSAAEPGVFAAGHAPQAAATRIVDFAHRQGITVIAGVAPDDAAGRAALTGMKAAAGARGIRVAGQAVLPARATGDARRATLASALESLGGNGALFLPFPAEALPTLNADLQTIVRGAAPLLGSPDWDGADLAALPAFARSAYAGYDPRITASFRQRFFTAFDKPPARGAALVYDLTATVILAAQHASGAGLGSYNLTIPGGFQGVQGPFTLTRDGAAIRQYAIVGVRDGVFGIIEPAGSAGG